MILVTGGAGFIGSHLVERLLDDGERVRVVDNCAPQLGEDDDRARQRMTRWQDKKSLELVEGDLCDPAIAAAAVDGIKTVLHLACLAGARRSVTDPLGALRSRCMGTAALLAAMEEARTGRLVLCSTAHALGEGGPHPVDRSPRPVSPYGAAAAGAEAQVAAWAATTGHRAAVVRLTSVYGPRMRPDQAVHRFLTCAAEGRPLPLLGSGDAVRDWLYVDDAVEVVLHAMDDDDRFVVAHAGTGRGTTVLGLVDLVREATELPAPVEMFGVQAGEPHTLLLDTGDTVQRLSWHPEVALRDGLLRTWAWLLAHGA